MKRLIKYLNFVIIFSSFSDGLLNVYPKTKSYPLRRDADVGDPLFLTPYLKKGLIKEAQTQAQVTHKDIHSIESYSGLFTVNEKYGSNLFFWFFPAQIDPKNAPVTLWLQGGPGASSLFGLFVENGPLMVINGKVSNRKYSWHVNHNLIFIDNPVGTGFSFTGSDAGYANNDFDAGHDVLSALVQFFQLFPDLKKNEFYITGESYAGKYIPALAHVVDLYNKGSDDAKINLKGLAIGNGYTDPVNQLNYGDYLYQISLIDDNGRELFNSIEEKGKNLILQKENAQAADVLSVLVENDEKPTLLKNLTGFDFGYNYMFNVEPYDPSWEKWVQSEDVRKAIHVGNLTFHTDVKKVCDHLKEDSVNSVAPNVAALLVDYRILIYSGQLDIIVAYPLTVNYLLNMEWPQKNEYRLAERKHWWVKQELAGYTKKVGNLIEVLVRNAGHMVPSDQPLWAWKLITRFTHNQDF